MIKVASKLATYFSIKKTAILERRSRYKSSTHNVEIFNFSRQKSKSDTQPILWKFGQNNITLVIHETSRKSRRVIRMALWIFYLGNSRISQEREPTKYPTEGLKVIEKNKVPRTNIKLQVLFKVPA